MASSRISKDTIHTVIGLALMALLARFIARDEPIYHIIPNLLLFTPFHYKCPGLWRDPFTYLPEEQEHQPIPEIEASEYSYEKLRSVTKNFRVPVVIRGIFADTPAVRNWHRPGYLANVIGQYEVDIMRRGDPYKKNIDDRYVGTIKEGLGELLKNPKSTLSLFFPVLSRFHIQTEEAKQQTLNLQKDVEALVRRDLLVDRIFPGFGDRNTHRIFHAFQINLGRGAVPPANYTGLAWHTEPGTNWFAQVHGSKRWHFLAPRDSPLLLPFRESMNSIATSNMYAMDDLHHRLPIRYVDLTEGDLIYNPDWEWHHTRNAPGLSIGVPMREINPYLVFRNNPWFAGVIARNHILGV